jgi:hypothetical protein
MTINSNRKVLLFIFRCLFFFAFLSPSICLAQMDRGYGYEDEDDEPMTMERVEDGLIMGAILAGVGFLFTLIPFTNTLGKVFIGIGAFVGIGGLVIYILERLFYLLGLALNLGFKLAIIGIAIYLAFSIVKYLYELVFGK